MSTDLTFLKDLFKTIDLDDQYAKFAMAKLYKYADNAIVVEACRIIQSYKTEFSRTLQIMQEASSNEFATIQKLITEGKVIPFMILCPDNPEAIRVYPNILLNDFSVEVSSVSSLFCNKILKTFIADLESDLLDDKKKQKWETKERYTSRLNQFVDVKTVAALTRYIYTSNEIKESAILKYGSAIEVSRKPLKLVFAETPKDFVTMYATGPQSCMTNIPTGGSERWAFFKDELTPPSFFAYCPVTKGVYAEKGGTVIARTILYNTAKASIDPVTMKSVVTKETWQYGRVYCDNSEYRTKFIAALDELNIKSLTNTFKAPTSISWKIPGFKLDGSSIYTMPWPYFDNMSSTYFRITFDKATNEFTVYTDGASGFAVHARSGHLRSTDYFTINCTNCSRTIKPGSVLEVVDRDDCFCSDNCAMEQGYIMLIDGTGRNVYQLHREDMIDLVESDFAKCSTLKAGMDLGFYIEMVERGVLPEEGEYRLVTNMSGRATIADALGHRFGYIADPYDSAGASIKGVNKIPIGKRTDQKTVTWTADHEFFKFIEPKPKKAPDPFDVNTPF